MVRNAREREIGGKDWEGLVNDQDHEMNAGSRERERETAMVRNARERETGLVGIGKEDEMNASEKQYW